jgi:hypothetical protein
MVTMFSLMPLPLSWGEGDDERRWRVCSVVGSLRGGSFAKAWKSSGGWRVAGYSLLPEKPPTYTHKAASLTFPCGMQLLPRKNWWLLGGENTTMPATLQATLFWTLMPFLLPPGNSGSLGSNYLETTPLCYSAGHLSMKRFSYLILYILSKTRLYLCL